MWKTAYRLLDNHADAAEVFSETFVSALEFSKRQRVRRFSALLVRIATAKAIDRLRQRYRNRRLCTTEIELSTLPAAISSPAEQAQNRELADQLRRALGRLPSDEAQVFCLRHLNEMSYRQIAKELGIKTNNVGVLLLRAKTKLRDILGAEPNEKVR